jgi:hypothetical protein
VLFHASFEEAKNIGDTKVLADIATAHGVSGWPGQANPTSVAEKEEGVRGLGISGAHPRGFNQAGSPAVRKRGQSNFPVTTDARRCYR